MTEPSGKTVLVVDDEEPIRSLVSEIVTERGHRVLQGSTGTTALDKVSENPDIDLVILDVMMPDMNGFEALQHLRTNRLDYLPVVMLTGQKTDAELMQGYELGADYYLTKPFKRTQLLRIVDYLIGDLPATERGRIEALI